MVIVMRYITFDVETAGGKLGRHPTISVGACVVPEEDIHFAEYYERSLVFYAELKPEFHAYEKEAMRVGCSHLQCLENIRASHPGYEPNHDKLRPDLVLELMQERCEDPAKAMERLLAWVDQVSDGEDVEAVTDTVLFDGGHVDRLLGVHAQRQSPFGWGGLDLDSLFRGYTGDEDASLSELNLPDPRPKPHRADQDAVYIAQVAHDLLYEKLRW